MDFFSLFHFDKYLFERNKMIKINMHQKQKKIIQNFEMMMMVNGDDEEDR